MAEMRRANSETGSSAVSPFDSRDGTMHLTPKVLLASSNTTDGSLWGFRLMEKRFDLITETNQGRVVQRCMAETPDMLILELDMLDEKALYLLHALREQLTVPVLVLLSVREVDHILQVYEAGADDCVIKPIEPVVFTAKITAWLRRSLAVTTELLGPLRIGMVHLSPMERTLNIEDGISIRLTNTETRLLYILMSRAGHMIPSDELIRLVWRDRVGIGADSLKNMICRLRTKLEAPPTQLNCIVTVPGSGYKFDLEARRTTQEEDECEEKPHTGLLNERS
jgi:two-component system, OmpR family, KDP operon response regulator KdpE